MGREDFGNGVRVIRIRVNYRLNGAGGNRVNIGQGGITAD